MSRTKRRKNAWNFESYDYVNLEDSGWTTIWNDPNSKEYKLDKVKYHKDKYNSCMSVPHWFTNLYWERPFRQENRQAIHRWMMSSDDDSMTVPVFKREVGWYYW